MRYGEYIPNQQNDSDQRFVILSKADILAEVRRQLGRDLIKELINYAKEHNIKLMGREKLEKPKQQTIITQQT